MKAKRRKRWMGCRAAAGILARMDPKSGVNPSPLSLSWPNEFPDLRKGRGEVVGVGCYTCTAVINMLIVFEP